MMVLGVRRFVAITEPPTRPNGTRGLLTNGLILSRLAKRE